MGSLTAVFGMGMFGKCFAAIEKIRKFIEDLRIQFDKTSPAVCVTISTGFASFDEASHIFKLLALADKRLYKAKNAGKNQVVSG